MSPTTVFALPSAEGPFYAHTRLPTAHGTFDVRVFRDAAASHAVAGIGHRCIAGDGM